MLRWSPITSAWLGDVYLALVSLGSHWAEVHLIPHLIFGPLNRFTEQGYSWKTNEYGLTSDTVVSYELVTPDGNVCTVTNKTSPDLFFALKGGFNNFVRHRFGNDESQSI